MDFRLFYPITFQGTVGHENSDIYLFNIKESL